MKPVKPVNSGSMEIFIDTQSRSIKHSIEREWQKHLNKSGSNISMDYRVTLVQRAGLI